MKEYGGYIEFENYNRPMLHDGAIALNCAKNCLTYLIRAKGIKKIKLPYYLCDSVRNECIKEGIEVSYYKITSKFLVEEISLENDEWLYVVNYYGQLQPKYLKELKTKYERVIVDNVQAYFDMPVEGIDTLYSCRKFFGVADGAFLYTDKKLDEEIETDISYNRMNFLLGRYEKCASDFYGEYVSNNEAFENEPIKYMSKLTSNLLHGIDYDYIKMQRTRNFVYLHDKLKTYNKLELRVPNGAFMYPFYCENTQGIKKKLQQEKIYIPTLWPNVLEDVEESEIEYLFTKNILLIPCDQRYDERDMKYLFGKIEQYM